MVEQRSVEGLSVGSRDDCLERELNRRVKKRGLGEE